MDGDSERKLAVRLLANDHEAWKEFLGQYEKRMQAVANRMTSSSLLDSEELVQGFLVERLYDHPKSMFGRIARGECPLWPRLRGA